MSSKDHRLSATAECLNWSIIVSPKGARKFTSGEVTLGANELKAAAAGRIKIFESFETFSDLRKDDILELGRQFSADYTGLKKPNKMDVALVVWHAICDQAETGKTVLDSKGKIRAGKGKLANRRYVLVHLEGEELKKRESEVIPPQALACMKIIKSFGTDEVAEADLKHEIEKQADMLRTKQDPWRIFQYYRPKLISLRYIRMI